MLIPGLSGIVQPCTVKSVAAKLPEHVVVAGAHREDHNHPHTMLSLVLAQPKCEQPVRCQVKLTRTADELNIADTTLHDKVRKCRLAD